jgi:hypothetical protein
MRMRATRSAGRLSESLSIGNATDLPAINDASLERLLNWLQGPAVYTLEVDTAAAPLRILTRAVLDMVLRAVGNLLLMNAHCAVAMSATDVLWGRPYGLGNFDLGPAPLVLAVGFEPRTSPANGHEIVRHCCLPDRFCKAQRLK